MNRENISLLHKEATSGLSLFFATLCIVDIFGVFPIIALPRAIVQCGWLGIPLVAVVFGLQIYTAALLGKSWNIATTVDPHMFRKNRYPFAAITELTLGRWMSSFVTILLDLTVFGGGIPNLLVASQNLQLFGLKVSEQKFDLSFCYWLLVVGVLLCPLMWLGSPRDMKLLVLFSTIAVSLTAALIWISIGMDDRPLNVLPVPTSPTWDKFISGYGMLAFQFDVHPTLMTIQVDMRNPRDIDKAVARSFFISGSLFVVTAGLAVWKYGGSTTANVLQIAPASFAVRAAILIAAFQLCFSSALGHSALFQHLEDQLKVRRSFGWKRCAMRSAVVFLGVAVGESVPRFDIVMALIGGTLTGPLVFILPPLIYARARTMKPSTSLRLGPPEPLPGSSRERNPGDIPDARIHSSSTHYAFQGGDDKVKEKRYSYVYYDDKPDRHSDSDSSDDDKSIFEDAELLERKNGEYPLLVEATEPPSSQRRRTSQPAVNYTERWAENVTLFDHDRISDWFGYSIAILGVVITISSTIINVKNTIKFVRFTPPCIVNATAAAGVSGFT